MSVNSHAKGKIVRRLGENIFGNSKFDILLKRKPHLPGTGTGSRSKHKDSDYAKQLKEKQKIKFSYGLREQQFVRIFNLAKKKPGLTGENFLILLERRLDNIIYRAGFAKTRAQARQLVNHGLIMVNGKKLDIPSALISVGDEITPKKKNGIIALIQNSLNEHREQLPDWLHYDADHVKITLLREPIRSDIKNTIDEQLVVEYYSR